MSIEKCQSCAYLNPVMYHCGKYLRGCETAIYLCQKENPYTNADRIRAMSDEELARRIAARTACMACILLKECNRMTGRRRCVDMWLSWLKSPVEVNE